MNKNTNIGLEDEGQS